MCLFASFFRHIVHITFPGSAGFFPQRTHFPAAFRSAYFFLVLSQAFFLSACSALPTCLQCICGVFHCVCINTPSNIFCVEPHFLAHTPHKSHAWHTNLSILYSPGSTSSNASKPPYIRNCNASITTKLIYVPISTKSTYVSGSVSL